ncbi:MAG: hypothetical protein KF723_22840 [Rhizobiaceae bacterium]|nr:hypothetical protein [Rhizobiaceae bacterium]
MKNVAVGSTGVAGVIASAIAMALSGCANMTQGEADAALLHTLDTATKCYVAEARPADPFASFGFDVRTGGPTILGYAERPTAGDTIIWRKDAGSSGGDGGGGGSGC